MCGNTNHPLSGDSRVGGSSIFASGFPRVVVLNGVEVEPLGKLV